MMNGRTTTLHPYYAAAYAPRSTRGVMRIGQGPSSITSPATIFHRMDEVDVSAKATNAAIVLNLRVSNYTKSWADWFVKWQRFNESERSLANLLSPAAWLLRSGDLEREVEARATELNEFRAQYPLQLSKQGGTPPPLVGPSVPPLPGPEAKGPGFPVVTVAIVTAIVAAAVVAIVYAPEVKGLFAAARRR